MMDKYISVLTNLAYVLVGIIVGGGGLEAALSCWAWRPGSTTGTFTDFTLTLDYWGMYLVGLAVVGSQFSLPAWVAYPVSLVPVFIWGASRSVLSVIIGMGLIAVGYNQLDLLPKVICFLGIAYGFNYFGDEIHRENHDLLHGVWHLVSAYTIYIVL